MTGKDEQNKKRKRGGGVTSQSEVNTKRGRPPGQKVTKDQSDVTAVKPDEPQAAEPAEPEEPEEPEETEEPVQKKPTLQKRTRGPGQKNAKKFVQAGGETDDDAPGIEGKRLDLQKTYYESHLTPRNPANFQVTMSFLAIVHSHPKHSHPHVDHSTMTKNGRTSVSLRVLQVIKSFIAFP